MWNGEIGFMSATIWLVYEALMMTVMMIMRDDIYI